MRIRIKWWWISWFGLAITFRAIFLPDGPADLIVGCCFFTFQTWILTYYREIGVID